MGLWGKRDDMVVHETEPYNAEPTRAALVGDVTPVEAFYSRNHGPVPEVDVATWRLRVDGMVAEPLELSLADLQERFEAVETVVTLQCAGNRRAGLVAVRDIPGEDPWGPCATSTASWTGARLRDVLAAAGIEAAAEHVAFTAPDVSAKAVPPQAYGSSIPARKALAGEVLLAWAMNGSPLPPAHGAPLRVVVPGYIGARSVKWVGSVTAQREPSASYFQRVAYRVLPPEADPAAAGPGDGISLGAVAVSSAILQPDDGDVVPAGATRVVGYAFAGDDRAVARLDVSTDGGGTWQQADLGTDAGPWAWRQWSTTVDLRAGDTEVVARAWDTAAAVQPERAAPLWNPKGYVNNSWARVQVHVSG